MPSALARKWILVEKPPSNHVASCRGSQESYWPYDRSEWAAQHIAHRRLTQQKPALTGEHQIAAGLAPHGQHVAQDCQRAI
jgi:hypothetical protein